MTCVKKEKTHFIKNEKKNPSLVALYLVILLNTGISNRGFSIIIAGLLVCLSPTGKETP